MHAFLSSDMWNGISGIVGILGLFSIVSALCAWWRSHRLVSDGRIDLTIRKIGKDDVRLCLQNTGEAGCDLISVFYKELDPVLVGEEPMPHTLQPGQGVLISCPRWTKESEIVVLYVGHRHLTRLWACRFDGMQGSSNRAFDSPILANPSWRMRRAMAYKGGRLFTGKGPGKYYRYMPYGRGSRKEVRSAINSMGAEGFTALTNGCPFPEPTYPFPIPGHRSAADDRRAEE